MSKEKLNIVKELMKEARKQLPHVTDEMLVENGAIYYMNGNDGTLFDWQMNDHLCEFFIFYDDEEMLGFAKLYINKDNTADCYVYPDNGHGLPIHTKKAFIDITSIELASLMYEIADKRGLYDQNIETLDFNVDDSICDNLLYDLDCEEE